MKKRVDVHGSEAEYAAWKRAAGDVPLGRWARGVLNEAAEERRALERRHGLVMGREPRHVPEGAVVEKPTDSAMNMAVDERGAFKPDFGSRLKEGKR